MYEIVLTMFRVFDIILYVEIVCMKYLNLDCILIFNEWFTGYKEKNGEIFTGENI